MICDSSTGGSRSVQSAARCTRISSRSLLRRPHVSGVAAARLFTFPPTAPLQSSLTRSTKIQARCNQQRRRELQRRWWSCPQTASSAALSFSIRENLDAARLLHRSALALSRRTGPGAFLSVARRGDAAPHAVRAAWDRRRGELCVPALFRPAPDLVAPVADDRSYGKL